MSAESLDQALREEQFRFHEATGRRDRHDSRMFFATAAATILISGGWLSAHSNDERLNANNALPMGLNGAALVAGAGALLYGMRLRHQADAHERAAVVIGQELRVEQGLASPTELPPLPPMPKVEDL